MRPVGQILRKPIVILMAVTLVIGLFAFRDYGLTWDEPLFYKYADALGYAYTPENWFSGHFDLNQSYGPSGDDHKNRGPGYLLLAREPSYLLQAAGLPKDAAWHLVNFIAFLIGVYFVYRLAGRLMRPAAAVAAVALFASQPLLWGHAFINPKDTPFMLFFMGAVWLGLRMADQLLEDGSPTVLRSFGHTILPAIFLGLATANRVLGPLAAILVVLYLLAQQPPVRRAAWLVPYVTLAALVTVICWPYLWEAPDRFLTAFEFMSSNPTVLPVLFADQIYRAYELPRRYLPFYLFFTLTEPVWPLFLLGLVTGVRKTLQDRRRLLEICILLGWVALPVAYVLLRRPPLYDGMRHFLFILPPIFIMAGLALEYLTERLRPVLAAALIAILLVPGPLAIISLHPYEYAYYNALIGGTSGAFRHYETEYWLTCYKEATQALNGLEHGKAKLYVHREAGVAKPYAAANLDVLDERDAGRTMIAGDYLLVNTRSNEDRHTFHDAPEVLSVSRAGATFCVIKRIP